MHQSVKEKLILLSENRWNQEDYRASLYRTEDVLLQDIMEQRSSISDPKKRNIRQ